MKVLVIGGGNGRLHELGALLVAWHAIRLGRQQENKRS
jgi:hypothetical protein